MSEKTVKYLCTYLISFLGGFFIPGITIYLSASFATIQDYVVPLLIASAIVGLLLALLFATILKTDVYLSTSSFAYGFLGAACGSLGFACGTLVLLLLGAK